MSDQSRALPDQPSLRYLKLEAKRRLSAGEFATLHDAQLAIAREHGQPSWTALKTLVEAGPGPALAQVSWVISRFRDAGRPGWTKPGEAELREHFEEHYLRLVPADTMARVLGGVAGQLRGELTVTHEAPLGLRAEISGLRLEAAAEPAPPYRLTRMRLYPLGQRVADPRVTNPPAATSGTAPAAAAEVASESYAELGLPGLVIAGGGRADGEWAAARGWARLEPAEPLTTGHRFPAYSVTWAITSTAVLRLVADGRVGLDDPANAHLRTVRLADEAVTVRDLLGHTGGVDTPGERFAREVPSLVSLTGPVVACGGPRGTFAVSGGGYAVLGQLIADLTGSAYRTRSPAWSSAPSG